MIGSVAAFYLLGAVFRFLGIECSSVGGILVITLISAVVFLELTKVKKQYAHLIAGGYLFRVALLLWDIFARDIYTLPNSGADTSLYHHMAVNVPNGFTADRGGVYPQVVATVYKLYGPTQIFGQYLNVLLGIWIIVLSIKCFEKIGLKNYSSAIKLEAFLPNIAIMNCILLRETPIMFLLALSLYAFLCWMKDGRVFAVITSFVLVFFAASMHSGAIAPVAAYGLTMMFYSRKQEKFTLKAGTVFVAAILVMVFLYVFTQYGDVLFSKFEGATVDSLVEGQSSADGGSGYVVGFNTGNSTISFIISSPIRMLYFLLSPFPWQWRGLADIIAFAFSSCFYALCIIRAFKVLKIMKDNDIKKAVLILTLFLAATSCLIFGWGVSNVGTAIRHRDKFFAQFIVMYAVGTSVIHARKSCVPFQSTISVDESEMRK